MDCFSKVRSDSDIPVEIIEVSQYEDFFNHCSNSERTWLSRTSFNPKAGEFRLIPNENGSFHKVLVTVDTIDSIWAIAHLPAVLPAGQYTLSDQLDPQSHARLALGWGMGSYRFSEYNHTEPFAARLFIDEQSAQRNQALLQSTELVRDLVNLPTNDLLPSQLAAEVITLAQAFDANVSEVVGEDLLTENYPLIHAVGRASTDQPRLLELTWGDSSNPHICLVGKGVCFDSGGLDIKPANGMRWMKKDMGGAAHVLGIARYVMQTELPVYLKVLIPAVENAIAGNAFRPGDIIQARSGKTVEIDNTDAEGRLILADALVAGCDGEPELIIDFATLTGAARVAVGTEIGAYFCSDAELSAHLQSISQSVEDPVWPLPLHQEYRDALDSHVADMVNSASSGYGGAIIAALFLQEFMSATIPWIHFDVMAFNTRNRPGRPKGGEAMGLRTVCELLEQRYR